MKGNRPQNRLDRLNAVQPIQVRHRDEPPLRYVMISFALIAPLQGQQWSGHEHLAQTDTGRKMKTRRINALQRLTRPSRFSCNPRIRQAGSLSLGLGRTAPLA